MAWLNRSSRRHRSMNLRQVARIARPLSFLKSGASRPVSHISSTLRWASPLQTAARGDLVDVTVDIDLQQQALSRADAGRSCPPAFGGSPRGFVDTQQALAASASCFVEYQSVVHSKTLPIMSYTP